MYAGRILLLYSYERERQTQQISRHVCPCSYTPTRGRDKHNRSPDMSVSQARDVHTVVFSFLVLSYFGWKGLRRLARRARHPRSYFASMATKLLCGSEGRARTYLRMHLAGLLPHLLRPDVSVSVCACICQW